MDKRNMKKRTQIKYFGTYLMSGDTPGPYTIAHDESFEYSYSKTYDDIKHALETDNQQLENDVMNAVNAHVAANYRAGFFNGLKAGAQLIINLTSDDDIIL